MTQQVAAAAGAKRAACPPVRPAAPRLGLFSVPPAQLPTSRQGSTRAESRAITIAPKSVAVLTALSPRGAGGARRLLPERAPPRPPAPQPPTFPTATDRRQPTTDGPPTRVTRPLSAAEPPRGDRPPSVRGAAPARPARPALCGPANLGLPPSRRLHPTEGATRPRGPAEPVPQVTPDKTQKTCLGACSRDPQPGKSPRTSPLSRSSRVPPKPGTKELCLAGQAAGIFAHLQVFNASLTPLSVFCVALP